MQTWHVEQPLASLRIGLLIEVFYDHPFYHAVRPNIAVLRGTTADIDKIDTEISVEGRLS